MDGPERMSFNVEHARELKSVEAAVLICGLQELLASAGGGEGQGARRWVRATPETLRARFPFWTPKQVRTVLGKLVDAGVLVKEQERGPDRTCRYAFGDEGRYLGADCPFAQTGTSIGPNGQVSTGGEAPICPNGQMGTETAQAIGPNGQMGPRPPSPPDTPHVPPTPNSESSDTNDPVLTDGAAGAAAVSEGSKKTARPRRNPVAFDIAVKKCCQHYVVQFRALFPSRPAPVVTDAGKQAVRSVLKAVAEADGCDYQAAEAECIRLLDRFLRDPDEWIAERGYELAFLTKRLNRLRQGGTTDGRGQQAGATGGPGRDRAAHGPGGAKRAAERDPARFDEWERDAVRELEIRRAAGGRPGGPHPR